MMGWYVLLLVLFIQFTLSAVFSSQDSIVAGDSIRGNDTIVSASGTFAMGFFSSGNSTNNYFGIWYNTISSRTVVWVANRESPLDSLGAFTIGRDGNLVLLNGTGKAVWSSNASVTSVSMNSTIGVLMDSGNFVLKVGGQILWQSFDYPSDTLLPGMKISFNLKTGQQRRLISWSGIDDPRPGQFSLVVDPQGHRQLSIRKGDHVYWRTAAFYGDGGASTATYMSNGIGHYQTFGFDGDEAYYTYSVSDNSVILRFMLAPSGKALGLLWQKSNHTWQVVWEEPSNICDFYSPCGPNAVCDQSNSFLPCQCLPPFAPKLQKEWDLRNWNGGCLRQVPLQCENGERFLKFENLKLPDYSVLVGNMSVSECESVCLHKCSCTAYAYANLENASIVSCLNWSDDLIDLVQNHIWGQDLYIRVNGSTMVGRHRSRKFLDKHKWVLVAAILVTLLFLISVSVYILRHRQMKMGKKEKVEQIMTEINCSIVTEGGQNKTELVLFNFKNILTATNNFSEANKLGEGGFGPVYKGYLPGHQQVAIKRLSRKSGQGLEEFMNELRLIANLQHTYLVRLLGCCVENDEKILIYEFMPNRSLDKLLFDPQERTKLNWDKRFEIMEGIAQGLLYIHKFSRLKVIHRDLKASNILLDEEMNPKISDFGMARIFGLNQAEAITMRVVGTYGYMSPEYAFFGKFSEKSDVFSFGVLVLEIVSGRRNANFRQTELSFTLLTWAWELWKEGKEVELVDPSIRDMCCYHEAVKCIHVGLLCVQETPGDRPTMSLVIHMLSSDISTLPSPKEPAFFCHNKNNSPAVTIDNCSINELTISLPSAR